MNTITIGRATLERIINEEVLTAIASQNSTVQASLDRAERALRRAGFTLKDGAQEWRPPLGPSASPLLDTIDALRARVAELEAIQPQALPEGVAGADKGIMMRLIKNVIRDVAELPDRSSPEDWPEAMLVTQDELSVILDREVAEAGDIIVKLIAVARAAFHAADDSEEVAGEDGLMHCVSKNDFDALSDALDALDQLPDDKPGYTLNGPARAEWALLGLTQIDALRARVTELEAIQPQALPVGVAGADFKLSINADSGYQSTMEGRCTASQYAAAVGALHNDQPIPPTDVLGIKIKRELFRFHNYQDWVNKAQSRYARCGVSKGFYITVDAAGHVMHMGKCFSESERLGLYPVTVYELKTNWEAEEGKTP